MNQKQFKGGFFLMTILFSFIFACPLFADESQLRHQGLTELLNQYVQDGLLDYELICKDPGLDNYLAYLGKTDPQSFQNDSDEIAFWINVYNAYNIKIVCGSYPVKSINEMHKGGLVMSAIFKDTIWERPVALVNGKNLTLKAIDHDILRGKFNVKEKRIQFGLSCGAKGCPSLRPEAYEGVSLGKQLQEQAKMFFNDPALNTFDIKKKRARLSAIMNWNAKYFGADRSEVLKFIASFLPPAIGEPLIKAPEEWTVSYNKYDLTLNDTKLNK